MYECDHLKSDGNMDIHYVTTFSVLLIVILNLNTGSYCDAQKRCYSSIPKKSYRAPPSCALPSASPPREATHEVDRFLVPASAQPPVPGPDPNTTPVPDPEGDPVLDPGPNPATVPESELELESEPDPIPGSDLAPDPDLETAKPKSLPKVKVLAQDISETSTRTKEVNSTTPYITSTTAEYPTTTTTTTTTNPIVSSAESPYERFGNGADRIVGGTKIDIMEVPYQASLQRSGAHICGACIISELYLLTAAHCNVASQSVMRVRVGSSLRTSGGVLHPVAEMISHPNYTIGMQDYDFCIIKLKTEMVFTQNCQPIPMIGKSVELPPESYVSIQGWGLTEQGGTISLPLLQITVAVVPTEDCKKVYGNKTITKRMFCAGDLTGGQDSCQGDSGGPAVWEGIVAGIVSWGFGCARAGYPGVYSKVSNQRDWIAKVTGILENEIEFSAANTRTLNVGGEKKKKKQISGGKKKSVLHNKETA